MKYLSTISSDDNNQQSTALFGCVLILTSGLVKIVMNECDVNQGCYGYGDRYYE